MLPPTSSELLRGETRPYFIWWADVTVAELEHRLQEGTPEQRAYWLGAILREANTRDVWLFTTPAEVRRQWPLLLRHLGRSRERWAWLLDLTDVQWPPTEQSVAG